MPGAGIEPAWTKVRRILSPVRLPISPPRREVKFSKRGTQYQEKCSPRPGYSGLELAAACRLNGKAWCFSIHKLVDVKRFSAAEGSVARF